MKFRNWFWGLFFILAAILIIVNQLGYFPGITLINLIITILLIPIIVKSISHRNFAGILFPLAIMGILYAKPLGIEELVPWPILAVALLGSIGLSFIFPPHYHHCHGIKDGKRGDKEREEGFTEVIDTEDDSIVNFQVRFGAGAKYVNTQSLKQANLDCSFGAMKVYFDNVKLSEEGAQINLDVDFSGVELYFPKDWQVVNNVNAVLGGVEEKNSQHSKEGPKVILTGKCSFSGIEIIYV